MMVRANHFAFWFLPLLVSHASQAQARPQSILSQALNDGSISPDPSHKFQRFLGWHYAAAAPQDTTKWQRNLGRPARANSDAIRDKSQRLSPLSIHPFNGSSTQNSSIAGFASAATLPTGFIPTAVVSGDFNGDGKLDLAISNGGDNTIYVYLGNGDGTFAVPEILYTQGQSPVWLAAAQLRTSGHLDLIAVDSDTKQVEVFTGNGDGTFQSGAIVATLAQTPTFVLAADFNNDGNMDLAVGLVVDPFSTEPQFEILLGDGSGSFLKTVAPPPIDNGPGESPIPTAWLALGDVNNDGWLDVVTTVEFGGAVAYLNQNGSAFLQGPVFGPADGPVTVALGDMNGDGCLDAIEAGGYGLLTIATGNCDGTFTQTTPIANLGDVDVAMVVADVDGDGNPDIVASSAYSDAEPLESAGPIGQLGGYLVSVLKGDGKGAVAPPAMYRVGSQAYALTVADSSGDQRPDIITVSQNENEASELLNDTSGGFGNPSGETIGYLPTASQGVITNAPSPVSVPQTQTIDLNGDGKPDVLLVENGSNGQQPLQLTALLNDGTGKLGPPIRTPIPLAPDGSFPTFSAGYFRSATIPDVIYANWEEPYVVAFMPGNGDGTFGTPVTLSIQLFPIRLVSGDFNGDGKLDFAVIGEGPEATMPQLDVFLGNGDGTFNHLPSQMLTSLESTQPFQLIAADFNHDGKTDLLIGYDAGYGADGNPAYNLDLAWGNGDGTFQMPTLAMPNFGLVTVADVNNDGYPDLIQEFDPNPTITQAAIDGLDGYAVAAITVYLGGPGGQFQQSGTYFAPGIFADNPIVGDFNGDGHIDVALPYFTVEGGGPWEARLQVFQGVGDGTFLPVGDFYQLPDYDQPMAGGDYRGLGVTDLLDLVGSTSSINTISAAPAPALTITPDDSPLMSNSGSATVTLAIPSSSSEVVQLKSSDPAVSVPSSLTFAAGQTQQSFSFTISGGFDRTHVLALSAELNGQSAVAYFPIANPNAAPGIAAQVGNLGGPYGPPPVDITAGESASFMFILDSIGGYSGVINQFACSGLAAGLSCDFAYPAVLLSAGGYAENGISIPVPAGTPLGTYNLTISGSNGMVSASATFSFNVGDFALSIDPTIIPLDSTNSPQTEVSGTFLDGLHETVTLTCAGLPIGASCLTPPVDFGLPASLSITTSASLAPADYPFQIVGSANVVSHSVNATLRVSNFTASLDNTSAEISNNGSAKFNVTFTSVNHFTSSGITLSCSAVTGVTCANFPSQVALADGGTATAQLVLTYVAPATAAAGGRPLAQALACLIMLIAPWHIRRRSWKGVVSIFACVSLLITISGCGGVGGGGGSSQTVNVSVVAQAPVYAGALEENVGTISLTVQQ
jgi:FG-GAP-like repeat